MYDMPYDIIKDCMTETWMKNTLEFLEDTEIEIRSEEAMIADGWTTNDTNIMQDVIDDGYRGKALASINRCRMYMKALFRSDISKVTGDAILDEAYNVTEPTSTSVSGSKYNWQPQGRPSPADRTTWRKFLEKTYSITGRYREWETPCGMWKDETVSHFQWTYGKDDTLYEKDSEAQGW